MKDVKTYLIWIFTALAISGLGFLAYHKIHALPFGIPEVSATSDGKLSVT